MALTLQDINVGSAEGDDTGDKARVGGQAINANNALIETAVDLNTDKLTADETNVTAALDGATLSGVTVAGTDKVLMQDTGSADELVTATAQSIADLGAAGTVTDVAGGTGLTSTGGTTPSLSHDAHTGQVTGATALSLDVTAITAQPAHGTIIATDTILSNDGGVLSEATFTQMDTYFNSSLNFTNNTGTVTDVAGGTGLSSTGGTTPSISHDSHTGDVTGAAALAIGANKVTLAHMEHGTRGDILYYGTTGTPARLGFGTSGDVLQTNGTGADPTWETPTTYSAGDFAHDSLASIPANDHIDWTSASSDFDTSGSVTAGGLITDSISRDVDNLTLTLYGGTVASFISQSGIEIHGSGWATANDIVFFGSAVDEKMRWDNSAGNWICYYPFHVDVINEKTAAAGVTIEGVLLKDNNISTSGDITTTGGQVVAQGGFKWTVSGSEASRIFVNALQVSWYMGSSGSERGYKASITGANVVDHNWYVSNVIQLTLDATTADFTDNNITTTGTVAGSNLSGSNTGDNAGVTSVAGGTGLTSTGGTTPSLSITDNAVTLAMLEHGTQGDILYYGATGTPTRLGFGTDGQYLKTQGTGANPAWADVAGGGLTATYKTANYTAVASDFVTIDMGGTARTITLPATIAAGDRLAVHAFNTSGTVVLCTIARNGHIIRYQGDSTGDDVTLADGETIELIATSATNMEIV